MLAYLVIREGSKYSDVFRLVPGESVVIGRAPTCQVVLKDGRCSRRHAEVSFSDGQWTVRDLDSRNGTAVGDTVLKSEWKLQPGEVLRIGRSQLVFVHELSEAFSDPADAPAPLPGESPGGASEETVQGIPLTGGGGEDPATITHRRGHTRYLKPLDVDKNGLPRMGRAANRLCRLAFELATVRDRVSLAETALSGLFEAVAADAGAVLAFPEDYQGPADIERLEVIASRSDSDSRYFRISPFLAATVLREGEAVLARNIRGDSDLIAQDDMQEQTASSVMCAPIRRGEKSLGLIHLYSIDPQRAPDPEDLEFTLAVAETLAVALDNLSQRKKLAVDLDHVRGENVQLREQLGVQHEIIGRSQVIAKVRKQIARAGPTNATVLIRGESGVGKELVARALHMESSRRDNIFLCINCAALTESLLESELFGHEQGAFTGATERKAGKFEAAHGGTIMLDEIGEMSPQLQAKFLRVLEGHSFERVGGSEPIRADVRVIAATNRNLEKDVEENLFRRDLYFRLCVVEIFVPGLRKRPDDIPILVKHFLERFKRETGSRVRGFTSRAMDQMLRYRWPGNIRELKNVIERAVVLSDGPDIDASDLMLSKLATAGETTETTVPTNEFTPLSLAEIECRHIRATLKATGWNKSQASQILGIERSTLDRKIRRYEIKRDAPAVR